MIKLFWVRIRLITWLALLIIDSLLQVVPMTLNKVSAPNNSSIVFELSSYGELRVMEVQFSCIQRAILTNQELIILEMN